MGFSDDGFDDSFGDAGLEAIIDHERIRRGCGDVVDSSARQEQTPKSSALFPARESEPARKIADIVCGVFLDSIRKMVLEGEFHSVSVSSLRSKIVLLIDGYLCGVQLAAKPRFVTDTWSYEAVDDSVLQERVFDCSKRMLLELQQLLGAHVKKDKIIAEGEFFADLQLLYDFISSYRVAREKGAQLNQLADPKGWNETKELLDKRREFTRVLEAAHSKAGALTLLEQALANEGEGSYSCQVLTKPRIVRESGKGNAVADKKKGKRKGPSEKKVEKSFKDFLFELSDTLLDKVLVLQYFVMQKQLRVDDFVVKRDVVDTQGVNAGADGGLMANFFVAKPRNVDEFSLFSELNALLFLLSRCNHNGELGGVIMRGRFDLTRALLHKYYGLQRTVDEQRRFDQQLTAQGMDGARITVQYKTDSQGGKFPSKLKLSLTESVLTIKLTHDKSGIDWNGGLEEMTAINRFISYRKVMLGEKHERDAPISYELVRKYCHVERIREHSDQVRVCYLSAEQLADIKTFELDESGRLKSEIVQEKAASVKEQSMFAGARARFQGKGKGKRRGKDERSAQAEPLQNSRSTSEKEQVESVFADIQEKMRTTSSVSHYRDLLLALANAVNKLDTSYRHFVNDLLRSINPSRENPIEVTTYAELTCLKKWRVIEKLGDILNDVYSLFSALSKSCFDQLAGMKIGESGLQQNGGKQLSRSLRFSDHIIAEKKEFNAFRNNAAARVGKSIGGDVEHGWNEQLNLYLRALRIMLEGEYSRVLSASKKTRLDIEIKSLDKLLKTTKKETKVSGGIDWFGGPV